MKKLFFIFLLIVISFFVTNVINNFIKNNDEIMRKIYYFEQNNKEVIEAIINDDMFIPGICGNKINVNNSYKKMKEYDTFSENLIAYDKIMPKNRLIDNYNKYIIAGNPNKKEISLIILINEEDKLDDYLKIIENKNIETNFFIDGAYLKKNIKKFSDLNFFKNIIGNLSYNGNYADGAYIWMDSIIKKITKQENNYCYSEKKNKEYLNICSINNSFTIMPSLILKNNYFQNIKKKITNGMIISMDANNELINELPIIIKYIHSKGYKIVNLDNLLNETN